MDIDFYVVNYNREISLVVGDNYGILRLQNLGDNTYSGASIKSHRPYFLQAGDEIKLIWKMATDLFYVLWLIFLNWAESTI